jgi:hypothetical protein
MIAFERGADKIKRLQKDNEELKGENIRLTVHNCTLTTMLRDLKKEFEVMKEACKDKQ